MEKIEILNSKKEKLSGILENCDDSCNKKNLIILCHGFMGHKNNCFFPALSKELNDAGYSVFRFDFSGCKDSEGKFDESTMTKNIDDLKSVCDYFKKNDYSVISILGHSMGGSEVIGYQSKYNFAKCIVAVAPRVYNAKAVKERYSKEQLDFLDTKGYFIYETHGKSFRISKEFIDDRIKNYTDMRGQAKKISCPVLLIHGENDTTTSLHESKDLIKVLNKKSMLKLIPDEDHNFTNHENQKILFNSIITFLAAVNRGIF